ncbi:MAG TPA: nucleoside-diphosphate kinase [Candidatus Binatia bacterium]|nr:nucleoside-diphosphate kinase [Candidatus Binatia bacterium]
MERTLSIVKPDAVAKNQIGAIIAMLEAAGLRIAAARFLRLSKSDAERFYAVHRERPFFQSLTTFMSEAPILVMALEGANAIAKNREVMGATDPAKAAAGTIRKAFGTNVERNAVHGSDAPETAKQEIAFFFGELEIPTRA